jgi:hypothetical protein
MTDQQRPTGQQPGPPPKPKKKVKLSGKTEKESEGAVGGPVPGFKGTKRTLGPAGAPVNKLTGEVFKEKKDLSKVPRNRKEVDALNALIKAKKDLKGMGLNVQTKQGGGMANTGRMNLLEEVGRIDAEHMNPNRRAEKSRVIGELNRGYKKGGAAKKAKGGVAKKQGGGAMYSRGYGVGEPSRRTPTALLDRGPAYKKGGVIKAETGVFAKAKRRKPSGRLNIDDIKRAMGRKQEDPTKSTARERAIIAQHTKKKPKKSLMDILRPKHSEAGHHADMVAGRRLKSLLGGMSKAKPARGQGGGIAKRGLGIIKKG